MKEYFLPRHIKQWFSFFFFSFILFGPHSAQARELTPQAEEMYKNYYKAVVQVRVISRGSGEKSTLGSGFFFTENGMVATNYHVVSDAVNYPELFYIEYIMYDGQKGKLELLNIDPVHDLAVLRAEQASEQFLPLGHSDFSKGAKIFSFGNPFDLGLIIVEGLFNGLLEHSMYRKILFSGALNPGMSGGPAVSDDGRILGINVATATNDISFFVPVEYLDKLYQEILANGEQPVGISWRKVINKRLIQSQEEFLQKLIGEDKWDMRHIGMAMVPGEISDAFKCWGQSGDNKRFWVKDEYLTCSTEDRIFISDTMHTGMVYFQYESYESRSNDPIRFYNIYEKYAANREFYFANATERDAENFECEQDFVDVDGHYCKIEVCARPYKMFEGIYDMSVQLTRADLYSEGLVVNLVLLGVTEPQSKSFLRKFLKRIEWLK